MLKYKILYYICSILKLYYRDWSLSSTILSVFMSFLLYFILHVNIVNCSKFVLYSMIFYMIMGRISFIKNNINQQYNIVCKYCDVLRILIKK